MNQIAGSELIKAGQTFGKFYLVKSIGEGGTSKIFKALQQPISRVVALKIPTFTENGDILTPDEFLSEATLMAKLDHPNIARIYDFGVTENRPFICMEYIEGLNLLELTQEQGPWSLSGTIAIALQTLDALFFAHTHHVLHLDLSPANILISEIGTLKLLDFGMAGKKPVKGQGKVFGTPAYLSPEHVLGKEGKRESDLFSFGSLIYYLATGEPLFDPGKNNSELKVMLSAIENGRHHPPEEKIRRLPPALAHLVKAALAGNLSSASTDDALTEIKTLWQKLENNNSATQVLKREASISTKQNGANAGEVALSNTKIQETYTELRNQGRHREAVALLENELIKQPNNPFISQLLSLPPEKAKSLQETMAVVETTFNSIPANKNKKGPEKAVRTPLFIGLVGILILTTLGLGLNFWFHKKPSSAVIPTSGAVPVPKIKNAPTVSVSAPSPMVTPVINPKSVPPKILKAEIRNKPLLQKPSAPLLTVIGPSGTRVLVNDSVSFITPSPSKGWPLPSGLVNLTLTAPGETRSINTSLFVAADSAYGIHFDADGSFSVTRSHQ